MCKFEIRNGGFFKQGYPTIDPPILQSLLLGPPKRVLLILGNPKISEVSTYPDASEIPARNKAKLRAQGLEVCSERLDSCLGEAKSVRPDGDNNRSSNNSTNSSNKHSRL